MVLAEKIADQIAVLEISEQVSAINAVREKLHSVSPFKDEPVDFVKWVSSSEVQANDYNPNKVAPPEMKLLELSIINDGYTQPIVGWSQTDKGGIEVVDGFHRSRVGKESKIVSARVSGYLPVVDIRSDQSGKNERMSSTIRHNRARGKHQIDAMSEIVIELKNRNWRNARIARELGMDEEEVLRLCQISGLEHLFSDKDFSRSWEADDAVQDWQPVTDQLSPEEISEYRIPHETKTDRIFHTFDKWECQRFGLYATHVEGMSKDECTEVFAAMLRDLKKFKRAAAAVIDNWTNSCEHYLTNSAMNRIAWLGQAAVCYETKVPAVFCGGFSLLTLEEQQAANEIALAEINRWRHKLGLPALTMEDALASDRQTELY